MKKCVTCKKETTWFVPREPRIYVCNAHQCIAPVTRGGVVQEGSTLHHRGGLWSVGAPTGGPVRLVSGCEVLVFDREVDTTPEAA